MGSPMADELIWRCAGCVCSVKHAIFLQTNITYWDRIRTCAGRYISKGGSKPNSRGGGGGAQQISLSLTLHCKKPIPSLSYNIMLIMHGSGMEYNVNYAWFRNGMGPLDCLSFWNFVDQYSNFCFSSLTNAGSGLQFEI